MTPPCAIFLGALLAIVGSAQFPGLPNIDPGHVAGVVKSAEKEVKQTLSPKTEKNIASGVAKDAKYLRNQASSVADNVAQNARQTASAVSQTSEATKTVAVDAKAQQQVGTIGGPPALATAPVARAPVASEGSHDVDHANKLLETAWAQTDHSKFKQVLADTPKNMALDSKGIKKAADSLQDVHDLVHANTQQIKDLAPKGHDLASKMIFGRNPSKAAGGVSNVVDLKSDLKNVAHVAEKGVVKHVDKIDANTVRKFLDSDGPVEDRQASEMEEAAERVGSRWKWSLFFIVGAVATLFIGGEVAKRRDARFHTLLSTSDMAGSMGGGPTHSTSRMMQSEKLLWRQV